MKFYVLSENLQKKLSFLNHAVSTKSQLPILLTILFEAKHDRLLLSTTDLEIGLQTEIPAHIEEEGSICIPAKVFTELISSLSSEKIVFETQGSTVIVKTSKTRTVFQITPKEEFPTLYEEKGALITTIEKEIFHSDLSKVVFAASSDGGRPALSGILMKKEPEGYLLVATDGYRLSLKRFASLTKTDTEEVKPLLIPARVFKEAFSIKEEGAISLYASLEKNQVIMMQDTTVLVGRLIDAQFPPYEKITPTEHATTITFDSEEMHKAVKICAIFARESANIIKLSLREGKVVVSANSPSVGENTVEVEAKLTGEENEIAFNARYLLDLFTNVNSQEMVFEMTGPLNPGVFKVKEDPTFLHLIMPIRVQG